MLKERTEVMARREGGREGGREPGRNRFVVHFVLFLSSS